MQVISFMGLFIHVIRIRLSWCSVSGCFVLNSIIVITMMKDLSICNQSAFISIFELVAPPVILLYKLKKSLNYYSQKITLQAKMRICFFFKPQCIRETGCPNGFRSPLHIIHPCSKSCQHICKPRQSGRLGLVQVECVVYY